MGGLRARIVLQVRALPGQTMMQRIVAPAAAVIGTAAAAMAAATITLLLTIPAGKPLPVASGTVLPFFEAMLSVIADAFLTLLTYL